SSSKTMGRCWKHMGLPRMKAAGLVVAARTGDRTGCLRRDHREGTVGEVGPGTSVAGPAHEGAPADVVDPPSHRDAALGALVPLLPTLAEDPGPPERRGGRVAPPRPVQPVEVERHQASEMQKDVGEQLNERIAVRGASWDVHNGEPAPATEILAQEGLQA